MSNLPPIYAAFASQNTNFEDFSYTNKLFSQDSNSSEFYKILEKNLPPFFTRKTASNAIGGLISPKTLANLDSLGQGPTMRVKLGTRVGYERDSFISWLKGRMREHF